MELLDEHAVAKYLGGKKPLSVRTVQRMRLEGKGPKFVKMGALVRYVKDDLDEYIADRRRTSTSETEAA